MGERPCSVEEAGRPPAWLGDTCSFRRAVHTCWHSTPKRDRGWTGLEAPASEGHVLGFRPPRREVRGVQGGWWSSAPLGCDTACHRLGSSQSGGRKSRIQARAVSVWCGVLVHKPVFSLYSHVAEGARGLSGVSLLRAPIPSRRLHPQDPIASQRSHLRILTHTGVRISVCASGEYKHSDHSTMQEETGMARTALRPPTVMGWRFVLRGALRVCTEKWTEWHKAQTGAGTETRHSEPPSRKDGLPSCEGCGRLMPSGST